MVHRHASSARDVISSVVAREFNILSENADDFLVTITSGTATITTAVDLNPSPTVTKLAPATTVSVVCGVTNPPTCVNGVRDLHLATFMSTC